MLNCTWETRRSGINIKFIIIHECPFISWLSSEWNHFLFSFFFSFSSGTAWKSQRSPVWFLTQHTNSGEERRCSRKAEGRRSSRCPSPLHQFSSNASSGDMLTFPNHSFLICKMGIICLPLRTVVKFKWRYTYDRQCVVGTPPMADIVAVVVITLEYT